MSLHIGVNSRNLVAFPFSLQVGIKDRGTVVKHKIQK